MISSQENESTPTADAAGASVDPKDALANFASGVTIVTTIDDSGTPRGFTATAFTSVSGSPPQILVCLDTQAECYAAFSISERFAVNILAGHQEEVAMRFASKGSDKFRDLRYRTGEGEVPILDEAAAVLQCRVEERIESGDHLILIGEVTLSHSRDHRPLIYFRRRFHELPDGRR